MSSNTNRVLAEGVLESIYAMTPNSRHRHPRPRISLPAILGWAAVASFCLLILAVASTGK